MSGPKITPYPLSWPKGKARAKARVHGQFRRTFSEAEKVIREELGRLKAGSFVMSSNMLRSNSNPADPGVAVWFLYKDEWRCIAIDRYYRADDNTCAIAASVEALRTVLRHGGMEIFEQALQGFSVSALPAPGSQESSAARTWWQILRVDEHAPSAVIEAAYRELAKEAHPDKGGSHSRMSELNAAIEEARKARVTE